LKKIYLIWKDPAANTGRREWVQLTGREFYGFVRSPEAKGRYFIRLSAVSEHCRDGMIIIEASRAEYMEWRREQDHSAYLREQEKPQNPDGGTENDTDPIPLHLCALVADDEADVEEICIRALESGDLHDALSRLSADEYAMIAFLYLSGEKRTEQAYADLKGIKRKTVSGRKGRALRKLVRFLEK
jgi:hypothetical protein